MKKALLILGFVLGFNSMAQTANLNPAKDNALFENNVNNSSGLGYLYSGRTCSFGARRALMQFDIAGNIPAGATITSVNLQINVIDHGGAADDFSLYVMTSDWGEGTSPDGLGTGSAAVAPDATWANAMHPGTAWTTAGGDFNPVISGFTNITTIGNFNFSSAQMVTDVQNWLDTPASDFGWVLRSGESTTCSAIRIGSKDLGTAPVLTVNYTVASCKPNAVCQGAITYLDGTGNSTINDSDLDGGSTPVCGTSLTFSASQTAFSCSDAYTGPDVPGLIISAVYDGPLGGGTPKGIELYAFNNILDLSQYGIGSANNGGGSDGEEFTFPAVSVLAGTYIYVATEMNLFSVFFGFTPDYTSSSMLVNGDDAIELFQNGSVIDVFGDINMSGSGQPWEYMDSWAYRNDNTGPNNGTFNDANWTYGGPNALDGESDNGSAATPVPIGTHMTAATVGASVDLTVADDLSNDSTCTTTVLVLDTLAPTMTCASNFTVALNSTGDTTLTTADFDNGSTDPCGITLSASQLTFDCSDDTVDVWLVGTDLSGNMDSCSVEIIIDASGVLSVATDSLNHVSCVGLTDGEIYVTVTGGTGSYTYDWDNDGTGDFDDAEDLMPLDDGTYILVAEDGNGCQGTITETVNDGTPVNVSVNAGGLVLTASATPATYQWLDCPGLTTIAGETGQSYTAPAAGDYAVIVTENGCVDTSACITVNDSTGIGFEDLQGNFFTVYPNPSNGQISVVLTGSTDGYIDIVGMNGKLIERRSINESTESFDLSELSNGIYFVRVSVAEIVRTQKIVIQH